MVRQKAFLMRYLILSAFLLTACNNNPGTDKSDHPSGPDATGTSATAATGRQQRCYLQVVQRDTMVAALTQDGAAVSGRLSFDNYEKDGSTGTVAGVAEGDLLKLWYSYQSEGTHSVMEVWFRQQGAELVRGIGPSGMKGDTFYFTDPRAVTFDGAQRMQQIACANVPQQYR